VQSLLGSFIEHSWNQEISKVVGKDCYLKNIGSFINFKFQSGDYLWSHLNIELVPILLDQGGSFLAWEGVGDPFDSTESWGKELLKLFPRVLEGKSLVISTVEEAIVGGNELFMALEEVVELITNLRTLVGENWVCLE